MMIFKRTTEGETHDYTRRYWGHDYTINTVIDGGQRLALQGWGTGIREGDYLILPNGAGTTRYRVESVTYYANPSDMWRIEARFAPRE